LFNHGVDQDHLSTYINKSVVNGAKPTTAGLHAHIGQRWDKEIDKVKTDKSKQAKTAQKLAHQATVKQNSKSMDALLQMHHHIQNAKNALLPAMQRGDTSGYRYDINGHDSPAEGSVVVTKENRPTKLINRGAGGFAQINLSKGGFGK
jgi:hypothetical protein